MIKLLIADDEALVCVGLQSMLKWEDYQIEIVGIAHNGAQAEEMIESLQPDIVITDIKMPVKTGLQVAEAVRKRDGRTPKFIILTSYEDFQYARSAIEVRAVDYLVKLELTPKMLEESILRAISMLKETEAASTHPQLEYRRNLQDLRDKFFIRLFNHLFESREQYLLQKNDLELELNAPAYLVCTCRILGPDTVPARGDKLAALCSSTVQMARETLTSSGPCHITSLDLRNFAITLPLPTIEEHLWLDDLQKRLHDMAALLHNYFNVVLIGGIGVAVADPYLLYESYQSARKALPVNSQEQSLVFFSNKQQASEPDASLFDYSALRSDIRRAFEEMDVQTLHEMITRLIDRFAGHPHLLVSATDAASNLLYMATSLLSDGEQIVEQIFGHEPEGYRSIYQKHSMDGVIDWLIQFRDGCCSILPGRRQTYKEQVVRNVQEYIKRNLDSKLSLNQVADIFSFSPNYLSHLFSKTAKINFVEYVTETKISSAKEMMQRGEGRIYEISQQLGYESAFYFSKVFKKVEGVSPREYIQRLGALSQAER